MDQRIKSTRLDMQSTGVKWSKFGGKFAFCNHASAGEHVPGWQTIIKKDVQQHNAKDKHFPLAN